MLKAEKSLREGEGILALIWTISAIVSYRHLKNSGGTHDICDVMAVGLTGQFLGSFVPVKDSMNKMNAYLKCGL